MNLMHGYRINGPRGEVTLLLDTPTNQLYSLVCSSITLEHLTAQLQDAQPTPNGFRATSVKQDPLITPQWIPCTLGFPGCDAGQYITLGNNRTDTCFPDAVLCLVYDDSQRILVVRHAQRGWELPGGTREKNETVLETAAREVLEEGAISIDLESVRRLCVYTIRTKGTEHQKVVVCARVNTIHDTRLLQNETNARDWVPLETLYREEWKVSPLSRLMQDNASTTALWMLAAVLNERLQFTLMPA